MGLLSGVCDNLEHLLALYNNHLMLHCKFSSLIFICVVCAISFVLLCFGGLWKGGGSYCSISSSFRYLLLRYMYLFSDVDLG